MVNLRNFVVCVYVIAFIISIVGFLSISASVWQILGFGESLLVLFSVLVGFCGVLLAYFVYEDGEAIEGLRSAMWSKHAQPNKPYKPWTPPPKPSKLYIELVNLRRNKGYINPELNLESDITEKMKTGKTREEAIAELYSENFVQNETEKS